MTLGRAKPRSGLIFHSDRRLQYCSNALRVLLAKNEIQQSMSRSKGKPYDNAPAETLFSRLKCECIDFLRLKTRRDARQAFFEYIEIYYGRQRRHSALGWISPYSRGVNWPGSRHKANQPEIDRELELHTRNGVQKTENGSH